MRKRKEDLSMKDENRYELSLQKFAEQRSEDLAEAEEDLSQVSGGGWKKAAGIIGGSTVVGSGVGAIVGSNASNKGAGVSAGIGAAGGAVVGTALALATRGRARQ